MNRRRRRRKKLNIGRILVPAIIVALALGMFIRITALREKTQAYEEKIAELQSSIDSENARTEELEDYASYVKTDEYAEKIARTKLGLIYKNETVYKEED